MDQEKVDGWEVPKLNISVSSRDPGLTELCTVPKVMLRRCKQGGRFGDALIPDTTSFLAGAV